MKFEDLGPLDFEDLGAAHYKLPRESKVHPELLSAFSNMAKEYFDQTGEALRVTDSFRTNAEQADLYKRKPKLASPPGRSRHEVGQALDIDTAQVPKLEELGLLDKHGFVRPALSKGETWHVELPRFEKAEKIAGKVTQFQDLGPVKEFEDLGTGKKKTPEELAKAAGVPIDPTLNQPLFFDPINLITGPLGLTRAIGAKAVAKAIPGMLGAEGTMSVLDEYLTGKVPESTKPLIELASLIGGGVATSKLLRIPGGVKLALKGGRAPLPPEEALVSELTAGVKSGKSAQEVLKDLSTKYGRSVQDLVSETASSATAQGAAMAGGQRVATSPWDSSDLGEVVVRRQIPTEFDSTLGPKGTMMETMPLHEGHVAMREQFGRNKDITAPMFQKWKNTFKTNERIFSELDDIAPGFHDEFWGKLKWSENIAHKNTQEVFKGIEGIRKKFGDETGARIGIDLISQRKTGPERLKMMGLEASPLSLKERELANQIQIQFDKYLDRINEARALAGRQPIKRDANYVTFMSNFVEKVSSGVNPIAASSEAFTVPTGTPFRFEKELGGRAALKSVNIFDIFKNYAALAERHINISPHMEKIKKFLRPMALPDGTEIPALQKVAPNAANALTAMAQVIAGTKPPMSKGERLLSQLSNNLVMSTLGAYPRSVINQTGALATAVGETGTGHLVKGLTKMLDPSAGREASQLSKVLAQRRMDVVLEDLGANWFQSKMGKAKHYAMLPLEVMDDFIAKASWWAARSKAASMGMDADKAIKFADKVVVRTQASASPIDRAMVQSSPIGRMATAFQTFTIADANYIARNIFGRGNINFSTAEGFKKLVNMTLTGMALNLMYRDLVGMPPGLPEPFYKASKALEEGAGPAEAGWEAAKEFAPYVPVAGSMAYGRMLGGALGGAVGDLVTGYKSPAETGAMFLGVPGMGVLQRALKTEGGIRALSDLESMTGLPIGPRAVGKRPPLNWQEVLLGREPQPQKRGKWRSDEFLRGFLK